MKKKIRPGEYMGISQAAWTPAAFGAQTWKPKPVGLPMSDAERIARDEARTRRASSALAKAEAKRKRKGRK